MLPVPKFLIKYYSKKISEGKYKLLEKYIEEARLPITTQKYLALVNFYSLVILILNFSIGIFIYVFNKYEVYYISSLIGTKILSVINSLTYGKQHVNIYITEIINKINNLGSNQLGLIVLLLMYLLMAITISGTVRYAALIYPQYISSRRREEINLYLPHAINMMYGVSSGGISAYDVFKTIAESKIIFGELSKEFKIIIDLVDTLGVDLISAMDYVRKTTPSTELSNLLSDLIFILRGGGSISKYFANKSKDLFKKLEISYSSYVDFLSVLSETYLSVFVLFPLLLLIVLIVMKVTGENVLNLYVYSLYFILPLATLLFIYLIKLTLPIAPAKFIKYYQKEDPETIITPTIVNTGSQIKTHKLKREIKKILKLLSSIFKDDIYTVDIRVILIYDIIVSSIILIVLTKFLKLSINNIYPIILSIFILPTSIVFELRERKIRKMEARVPEIFKELAMLNEAGLTILESLEILSEADIGELKKELLIVKSYVDWNYPVARSFRILGERIRSEVVSKVVSITSKVLEVSPSFKDAFNVVSDFAESEVILREKIRNEMFLYVVIIYMAIAIFLLAAYILIHYMLSALHPTGAKFINVYININNLKDIFYRVALIVSVFSGIIAGVIGNGKILSGLKHSYFFLMMTYIVFTYLLR